jgi:periplasmic mercuric ion binding protein
LISLKAALAGAAIGAAAVFCPLCGEAVANVAAEPASEMQPAADTATVRLRIVGMTCSTCPTTARLALRKLGGVLSAEVSYADSSGVVRYDPSRVTPAQIAAHLTKLTGYRTTVLADAPAQLRPPERG